MFSGCDMIWMIEYFKTVDHIKSVRNLKCSTPSTYVNTNIIDLELTECSNRSTETGLEIELNSEPENESDSVCAKFECLHGGECKVDNNNGVPYCDCFKTWGGDRCETLLVDPDQTGSEPDIDTGSEESDQVRTLGPAVTTSTGSGNLVQPKIWTDSITHNSVKVITTNS